MAVGEDGAGFGGAVHLEPQADGEGLQLREGLAPQQGELHRPHAGELQAGVDAQGCGGRRGHGLEGLS